MKPVSIIGIGSPFGVDRLGWDAVYQLKEYLIKQAIDCESISFVTLDRPGISLIDYMDGIDNVILIDALNAGGKPGRALRLKFDQIDPTQSLNSTHGFGVAETLSLARILNRLPDKLVLIGMVISNDPVWRPSSNDMQALLALIGKEIDAIPIRH